MRRKISKLYPDSMLHIYQRAIDHGFMFYTIEDRIVYYTLSAVKARTHRIVVASASIMYTHIHQSVYAPSMPVLFSYLHDVDTSFTRMYNNRHSRKGRLFAKPPGCSQKYSLKDKKTNIIYVFNNHAVKKLCDDPSEERWSFLAYASSDHPFSRPIDPHNISPALRKAIGMANRHIRDDRCLDYHDLRKVLPSLDPEETEQFIDYVISHYAWISFDACIPCFGSLQSMISTINNTTGGEYSIREEYSSHNDLAYRELIDFASRWGILEKIYALESEKKVKLAILAKRHTSAATYHLKKFFHLE